MFANPTSHSAKILFWFGIEGFEFHAVKVFAKLAEKSHLFLDIGSNLGYYSLLASKISRENIQCHAFEPMPSAYDVLCQNVKINSLNNIKTHRVALSNYTGEAKFYMIVNEKFSSFPQLTGDGGLNEMHSGNRSKRNFDVNCETLDNFAEKILNGKKIDLMKIDTEGNEHFVLEGGQEILKNHRPIIQCEILKTSNREALYKCLSDKNYHYYLATLEGLELVKDFENPHLIYQDYYLVPQEKTSYIKEFIK